MPTARRQLRIDEVALCERGANRGARVALFKREFTVEERERLAGEGKALPDGSFPIVSTGDLSAAVKAFSRTGDSARARRHIVRRARALERTDLLPEDWVSKESEMPKLHPDLQKRLEALPDEPRGTLEKALEAFPEDLLEKEDGPHAALIESQEKLTEATAKLAEVEKRADPPKDPKPAGSEALKKDLSDEARAYVEALEKTAEQATKTAEDAVTRVTDLQKADEERRLTERVAKLIGLNADERAALVKDALAIEGDARENLLKAFERASATAERGDELLKELGDRGATVEGTAHLELQKKATELRKEDPKLTPEQAYERAYSDPANVDLVKQHREEMRSRAN